VKLLTYSPKVNEIFMVVGVKKNRARRPNDSKEKYYDDQDDISGASMDSLEEKLDEEQMRIHTLIREREMKRKRSIYFVEFSINESFVEYIDDRLITSADEVVKNFTHLTRNKRFIKLIDSELGLKVKKDLIQEQR
jgi:hypothetical protein